MRPLFLLVLLSALSSQLSTRAHAARDFSGSGQYISAGNPSLGLGSSCTVSAWIRADDVTVTGITRSVLSWRSTTTTVPVLLLLDQLDAGVRFLARDNAGNIAIAQRATALTAGVVTHLAGRRAGNDVQVYVDGAAGTSATASLGTITVDALDIGANVAGSTTRDRFFDGVIAESAIWSVALTDPEIAALSRGVSPLLVRPSALVFYAPLVRDVRDLRGGTTLTDNGTTVADHPRTYRSE